MIPAEFIRMVEHVTNLPAGTVAGPSRLKPHVRVRSAVVHILRGLVRVDPDNGKTEPRYSLPMIGRVLNRDHSTICAAIERAERMLGSDSDFVQLVDRLQALADEQDLTNQLMAARIAEQVAEAEAAAVPAEDVIPVKRTRLFAADLNRKVKRRNDMLADDQDAICRARASIKLAEAIAAARAAERAVA